MSFAICEASLRSSISDLVTRVQDAPLALGRSYLNRCLAADLRAPGRLPFPALAVPASCPGSLIHTPHSSPPHRHGLPDSDQIGIARPRRLLARLDRLGALVRNFGLD